MLIDAVVVTHRRIHCRSAAAFIGVSDHRLIGLMMMINCGRIHWFLCKIWKKNDVTKSINRVWRFGRMLFELGYKPEFG